MAQTGSMTASSSSWSGCLVHHNPAESRTGPEPWLLLVSTAPAHSSARGRALTSQPGGSVCVWERDLRSGEDQLGRLPLHLLGGAVLDDVLPLQLREQQVRHQEYLPGERGMSVILPLQPRGGGQRDRRSSTITYGQ